MLTLEKEEVQLLLETALMAVGQNHFVSAAAILDGLECYRPGHESLDIARVVLMLSQRHSREAIDFIDQQGLVRHPESDLLVAFKGAALLQLCRAEEARAVLQSIVSSQDANAAGLAQGLLQSF